jgi:hypothetical protein
MIDLVAPPRADARTYFRRGATRYVVHRSSRHLPSLSVHLPEDVPAEGFYTSLHAQASTGCHAAGAPEPIGRHENLEAR